MTPAVPYASVIIPTHDRAATLATTVESVQRQTIQDIEILIVGDGPTADVAEIGRGIASQDPRVRFLEFPKAPGSGGQNRDRTIREFVTSDRIFYTDDDDLWLRQHVETIGPHLDRCHIVDTLPVSASLCGRLVLTLVNSGSPLTRQLLVEDKLKLMFDTHLSHRRSTYLALGSLWGLSHKTDIVRQMLSVFAGDASTTWCTLPVATAISLHGGTRALSSPTERRDEIAYLSRSLDQTTPETLTEQAHTAWTFFQSLNLFNSEPAETLDDYLRRFGMTKSEQGGNPTELLPLTLGADAHRDLAVTFALHKGDTVDLTLLKSVAPFLLDTVKTPIASWLFLRRALRKLPFEKAREVVRSIVPINARAAELLAIYEVYMLMWTKRLALAHETAQKLIPTIKLVPHEAELVLGDVLIASGRADEGLEYTRRAVARADRGPAMTIRLATTLMNAGRLNEARACIESMEVKLSEFPPIIALRRRLDGLLKSEAER